VLPLSSQEIARARHADLIREATDERLAASIREGAADQAAATRTGAFRWTSVVRGLLARRPAVRIA